MYTLQEVVRHRALRGGNRRISHMWKELSIGAPELAVDRYSLLKKQTLLKRSQIVKRSTGELSIEF